MLDSALDLISAQLSSAVSAFPKWYLKMSRNFPTNPIKKHFPACYLNRTNLLTNFIFFYKAS